MTESNRVRRLGQDDFDDADRRPTAFQTLPQTPDDVPMGLINAIELPEGVQLPTGVNLDYDELQQSSQLEESEELWLPSEFPPELVKEGKDKELASMKDFEVYRLVPIDQTTAEEQRKAIPTRWVETWKGDKVKCRLVAKDLKVKDLYRDKDELYAATPAFVTLKVMLTLALANRWSIWSLDIGTAFLHAKLPQDKRILVWPPKDQLQFHGYLWELEKAMYGLRVAPKSWQ